MCSVFHLLCQPLLNSLDVRNFLFEVLIAFKLCLDLDDVLRVPNLPVMRDLELPLERV